jgi:hypothetical protein
MGRVHGMRAHEQVSIEIVSHVNQLLPVVTTYPLFFARVLYPVSS